VLVGYSILEYQLICSTRPVQRLKGPTVLHSAGAEDRAEDQDPHRAWRGGFCAKARLLQLHPDFHHIGWNGHDIGCADGQATGEKLQQQAGALALTCNCRAACPSHVRRVLGAGGVLLAPACRPLGGGGKGGSDSSSGKQHRLRLSLRQYADQTEKRGLSCYRRKQIL
jgi:hypothetical protein